MKKSFILLLLACCYSAHAAESARRIELKLWLNNGQLCVRPDIFQADALQAELYLAKAEALLVDHWLLPSPIEYGARLITASESDRFVKDIFLSEDVDATKLASYQVTGLKLLLLGETIIQRTNQKHLTALESLKSELASNTKQRITQELQDLGAKSLKDYQEKSRNIIKRWAVQESVEAQRRPIKEDYAIGSACCLIGGMIACSGLHAPSLVGLQCLAGGCIGCAHGCIHDIGHDSSLDAVITHAPHAAKMLRDLEEKKDK